MTNEFLIVIRSVGESTEQSLYDDLLSLDFIDKRDVHIVKETPFSESVKRTFEIAVKSNHKILVVLDADLIIMKDKFAIFLQFVRKFPHTVGVQSFCHDFFWKGPRRGGVHCYNIDVVKRYFSVLKFDKFEARPETNVKLQLEKLSGGTYVAVPFVCCFHGFLQAPEDIARTLYNQSRKSAKFNSLIIENFTQTDPLCELVRTTIATGCEASDPVRIDVGNTPEALLKFARAHTEEITDLQRRSFSFDAAQNVSEGFKARFTVLYRLSYSLRLLKFIGFCKSILLIKIFEKIIALQR